MKKFLLAVLALVVVTSAVDAGPLRNLASRVRGVFSARQSGGSASACPNGVCPVNTGPVREGGYPLRGNLRPHPNPLIDHLLYSPVHRGKFTREQLEKMTRAEQEAIHSDDHEGRLKQEYIIPPGETKTPLQETAELQELLALQQQAEEENAEAIAPTAAVGRKNPRNMVRVIHLLQQRSDLTARQRLGLLRVLVNPALQDRVAAAISDRFGIDIENLTELLELFLKYAPQILELILQVVQLFSAQADASGGGPAFALT